jgi:hypothetical protein
MFTKKPQTIDSIVSDIVSKVEDLNAISEAAGERADQLEVELAEQQAVEKRAGNLAVNFAKLLEG